MKAPWKQTPLEQAQKRSPALDKEKQIVELKAEIARMKAGKDMLLRKVQALDDACGRWRGLADEYEADRDRYQTLRTLDVMVMDKDGAKYLKGEELDKYIDDYHGVTLRVGVYNSINKRYLKSLSEAMVQTKEAMASNILNSKYTHKAYPMSFTITGFEDGLDTGSQGQETNQGNP